MTRDFGKRWSILTDMGIKLMPGGTSLPCRGRGCRQARREKATCRRMKSIRSPSRGPGSRDLEPHRSPPISSALPTVQPTSPRPGLLTATSPGRTRSRARSMTRRFARLLDKVRMAAPPTEHLDRFQSGAIVTIGTKDGRSYSATVYTPKGAAAARHRLGRCGGQVPRTRASCPAVGRQSRGEPRRDSQLSSCAERFGIGRPAALDTMSVDATSDGVTEQVASFVQVARMSDLPASIRHAARGRSSTSWVAASAVQDMKSSRSPPRRLDAVCGSTDRQRCWAGPSAQTC